MARFRANAGNGFTVTMLPKEEIQLIYSGHPFLFFSVFLMFEFILKPFLNYRLK